MIKKPKELTFKMVEGGDMVFCTIPTGTFNMSNPDGQEKLYHKVTLTKPFWITKYCVTTKQWREYAKYDCEGLVRQVEKCFPKHPIYMTFTRYQWDCFCEFLNKRYGHQLPRGYVFRLPTEAEWEWAIVGDKNGDIRKMSSSRFSNGDGAQCEAFKKLIKRQKAPASLPFELSGWIGSGKFRLCVGGRTECTDAFGVCDFGVWGKDCFVLDTFDMEGLGADIGALHYDEIETDPIRYAGRLTTRVLKKLSNGWGRWSWSPDDTACAHVVVGPDVETSLKKKELEPYPANDFGGRLLSDVITHGGMSSRDSDDRNSKKRFDRMISRENTVVAVIDNHEDLRGFFTGKEDAPWIQLNLNKRYQVTGLQIDALPNWMYNVARHIRVWTSEDGKTWREVAAENQRKHRYRFDLQRKNVTAKYIRIGREPGFMKDFFSLDKILVYGK